MPKSIRPKKIELGKDEKEKIITSKIKKFKNQHDESSAGSVKYDNDESEMIITQKLQERIIFQYKLRETQLACSYDMTQLKELEKIYKTYFGEFETMDGIIVNGELDFKKDEKGNMLYGFIEDLNTHKIWRADDIKKTIRLKGLIDDNKPKWYGIPMPLSILVKEFEIIQHRFKENLMKLTDMSIKLQHLGFDKTQINDVKMKGTIISNIKKLNKMEKDYEDIRLNTVK